MQSVFTVLPFIAVILLLLTLGVLQRAHRRRTKQFDQQLNTLLHEVNRLQLSLDHLTGSSTGLPNPSLQDWEALRRRYQELSDHDR